MLRKVAIIGPESTGKSTLTEQLAAYYQTSWVPEYARAYLDHLQRDYRRDDLLEIARGQVRAEEEKKRQAKQYLFCDTDLYVIKVWSEHRYSYCDNWILRQIAVRKYDLYLLTDIDIPWQDDPLREHPEPAMREYFYRIYRDIVVHSGVAWINIQGSISRRLSQAVAAIENIGGS